MANAEKPGSLQVPIRYWEDLETAPMATLSRNALAVIHFPKALVMPVLGREILIDMGNRSIKAMTEGGWKKLEYPLLELLVLVYLLHAKPEPLSRDLVSVKELRTSHFFQGPHVLRVEPLAERYGKDLKAFHLSAESLGGEAVDLADAAFRFAVFPRAPVYYLFWKGDEEFGPRVTVVFDRTIEKHLSADAIWGLVTLVTEALLRAPRDPFWAGC